MQMQQLQVLRDQVVAGFCKATVHTHLPSRCEHLDEKEQMSLRCRSSCESSSCAVSSVLVGLVVDSDFPRLAQHLS